MTDRSLPLTRLIAQLNRRIEGSLAARLKAEGLSVEHFRVLSALVEQNGRTMTDLAGWALVDPPTMTKIIDRLVAAGSVYRAPDADDRRKVLVFISDQGRALQQAAEMPARECEREVADALGAAERAQLTALLQSLLN